MLLTILKAQGMVLYSLFNPLCSSKNFKHESMIMALKPDERLTLIASDPGISTALVLLSLSRMLLIYLNYRFWIQMWKDTYANFLHAGRLDRNRDTRTYV